MKMIVDPSRRLPGHLGHREHAKNIKYKNM